jgi:hypothetical protein
MDVCIMYELCDSEGSRLETNNRRGPIQHHHHHKSPLIKHLVARTALDLDMQNVMCLAKYPLLQLAAVLIHIQLHYQINEHTHTHTETHIHSHSARSTH